MKEQDHLILLKKLFKDCYKITYKELKEHFLISGTGADLKIKIKYPKFYITKKEIEKVK